jgi:very-short-patch-repair endonuclease
MQGQTGEKIHTEKRQRTLRSNATDAEVRLWQCLRHRQIENCKFRRQHPFGNFILDFVCLERKLIIELDGSQHLNATVYDDERSRFLKQAGYSVLRFWNNEVFENVEGVLEVILRAVRDRATPSPPRPSP